MRLVTEINKHIGLLSGACRSWISLPSCNSTATNHRLRQTFQTCLGFFPLQFVLLFLLYFNYVKTYIEFPCVLGVHIRVLKVNYEWICLLVWILFLCIQCFYSISQLLQTTITFWRKVFPVQFWMCHEELTWTKDYVLLKDCENCSPVFKTSPILL